MKKQSAKVADVLERMGRKVRTIKPTDTIGTLARQLQQDRVGAMIVSEDGETVEGIISERDVAYGLAAHRGALHALPVAALMTRKVITCTPEDSIAEVTRVMCERHIRHLPVTDSKRLVGIIGMRDVFMHRLEEVQRFTRLLGSFVGAAQ